VPSRAELQDPALTTTLKPDAETEAALSVEEVRLCTALLERIVADRALMAELPEADRRALMLAAGRVSRPARHEATRLVKEFRRRKKAAIQENDRQARATAGIRVARQAPVFVAPSPAQLPSAEAARADGPSLRKPKSCYVCKTDFTRLHSFYDALCPECAAYNFAKRFQSVPLDGRVAVITGARVKIGFQTALKVLRAGGQVIATTRFPHDAAQRYAREHDFAEWRGRLQIHGLDLRHSPSVEIFTRYLSGTLRRLDILINNACQTVRRPPGFYAHLLDFEARAHQDLPDDIQPLLRSHQACVSALSGAPRLAHGDAADATGLDAWHGGGGSGVGLVGSAALSQVSYGYDDATRRVDLFPPGALDVDLQQVDLRTRNTWRLTLAEVATPEMLEVHLINAVAPFILCAKLKPLMARDNTGDKHIVNVSAMEGIFSRGTKTDRHPHTNMAKAALNMMTLTSARDYVRDGIHMNAVDTGWVTDEDPAGHATRKRDELDFQPPLDIVDGAARICDPFFNGLRTGVHLWGQFLKDYKPSNW
jgi:NAD(P)-dependent dehydrogenase (short-subunit alcohol dehydrogenase family)